MRFVGLPSDHSRADAEEHTEHKRKETISTTHTHTRAQTNPNRMIYVSFAVPSLSLFRFSFLLFLCSSSGVGPHCSGVPLSRAETAVVCRTSLPTGTLLSVYVLLTYLSRLLVLLCCMSLCVVPVPLFPFLHCVPFGTHYFPHTTPSPPTQPTQRTTPTTNEGE